MSSSSSSIPLKLISNPTPQPNVHEQAVIDYVNARKWTTPGSIIKGLLKTHRRWELTMAIESAVFWKWINIDTYWKRVTPVKPLP